jgi:hypothetical protein
MERVDELIAAPGSRRPRADTQARGQPRGADLSRAIAFAAAPHSADKLFAPHAADEIDPRG